MKVAGIPGTVTGMEKCACSLFAARNSKTIATHSRIRRLSPSPAPGPHCVDLMKSAGQLGNNKFAAGYSIGNEMKGLTAPTRSAIEDVMMDVLDGASGSCATLPVKEVKKPHCHETGSAVFRVR